MEKTMLEPLYLEDVEYMWELMRTVPEVSIMTDVYFFAKCKVRTRWDDLVSFFSLRAGAKYSAKQCWLRPNGTEDWYRSETVPSRLRPELGESIWVKDHNPPRSVVREYEKRKLERILAL